MSEDLQLKNDSEKIAALSESFTVLRDVKRLIQIKKALEDVKSSNLTLKEDEKNCLVPVQVVLTAKGNASANASLCVPSKIDLESLAKDKNASPPEEPAHADVNEDERRKLHEKHQKEKSWGRKSWKAKKDSLAEYRAECVLSRVRPSREKVGAMQAGLDGAKTKREGENERFNARMRELWLPANGGIVKDACCRQLVGFLSDGGYSYRLGKSVGVGFVPLVALADYLEAVRECGQPLVLVRETTMAQYRFAKMSVIV